MQWIIAIREQLSPILGWISNQKIFDFLPLNLSLHLIVSAAMYYFLVTRGFRALTCFLVVFGLGVFKEIFDLPATLKNGEYLGSCVGLIFDAAGIWLGHYLSRPATNSSTK